MIRLNKSRMDFQEKFEQMIEEYNSGTIPVDLHNQRLFEFLEELSKETQRADTENLSEEELAIVDILTKPDLALTLPEREEVKTSIRNLLDKLKQENLVLDWRKQQRLRAQVMLTVGNILGQELPQCYAYELFNQKSEAVYQHVYDSYYGEGKSIYTENAAI